MRSLGDIGWPASVLAGGWSLSAWLDTLAWIVDHAGWVPEAAAWITAALALGTAWLRWRLARHEWQTRNDGEG